LLSFPLLLLNSKFKASGQNCPSGSRQPVAASRNPQPQPKKKLLAVGSRQLARILASASRRLPHAGRRTLP